MMRQNHYFLTIKYQKCDLRRTISYCTTPGGDILGNIALIQYNFPQQEHTFAVRSHENSKRNSPIYKNTRFDKNLVKV